MKVLLISHSCMLRTDGQPKLHALAAFPDIEITALVPDRMFLYGRWLDAEMPENPAFRYVVGKTRWRNVMNQWYLQHYSGALSRVLRETQPDIVDIWEEPWSLACAQAVGLTRRLCPQARIIIETEQNIYKRLPPPFDQFQNYSLRGADFVVGRSTEAVDVIRRKRYQGPAGVVPNAVDCDLFRPLTQTERQACRAAQGWGGAEDFVVGYVGRLVPQKGLADALDALPALPKEARLVFVGDGPMRAELEAQANALGVNTRTYFTGGKPLTELPGMMNAMDVLILPSRTTPRWKEQFGRVLIEAGACGVAVVGSDSGAIPDVIADAGLIFPEGDAAALADCLRRLHDDPARRAQYGHIGYERARSQFSWHCIAAQMRHIFRGTLGLADQ